MTGAWPASGELAQLLRPAREPAQDLLAQPVRGEPAVVIVGRQQLEHARQLAERVGVAAEVDRVAGGAQVAVGGGRVVAAFEAACTRFGFEDDGDLRVSLKRIGIESIEEAIAIYATKLRAGSLPVDADNLRYFMGIARHCQGDRELLYFEQELVAQLERRAQITQAYLERRAAAFADLDVASRMKAIVDEILTASPIAPIAQHFWRRCLIAVSEMVPVERRADVRRTVCERIRRCYAATKQLRHSLVDLVVRLLVPDAVLTS